MRIIRWIKCKNNNSGETIGETLAAMLVVALAMLMLSGAIVSAARVNKASSELNDEFTTTVKSEISDVGITVDHDTNADSRTFPGNTAKTTVKVYKTEAGYYYYDSAVETSNP